MPTPAHRDQHQKDQHSARQDRSAGISRYYRAVQATLLIHLSNRVVFGFDQHESDDRTEAEAGHSVLLHVADFDDIDEAVRSGIVGFRLPCLTGPGMVALRLRAGDGTGVDTVATAALALAESMGFDGLATTALTDGADGLYLIAFGVGSERLDVSADKYSATLTLRAPEIATTDVADFDGRTLLEPLSDNGFGLPSPYSMVPDGADLGVIVPLTLDEVAAASAGMPLDIGPGEVADRIAGYGDLAAALSEATARSA